MKLSDANNGLIGIQANMKKAGDYEAALKVAEEMVLISSDSLVIVEADEWEGRVVLSSVAERYQRAEWIDLYKMAKAA